MKAIIFICILFVSLLILSPGIAARELAKSGSRGQSGDPNKPAINKCGKSTDNPAYSKCIANQKPKPTNCIPYDRGVCKPPKGT